MAHKKYYCSASAKSNPPPTSVRIVSDNEDEEPIAGPAPKFHFKQENGSKSRATLTPPHSSTTPSILKPQTPSSNPRMTLQSPENNGKELKLVKQQDLLQDPAPALMLPGILSNHFVCEGCCIKFKSVNNLQAHQARYCGGLQKSEDLSSVEAAIIKRTHQQKQNRISPQQLPQPLTAANMMTFLNAKSIEKQLALAASQAATAAAITKEKQPTCMNSVMTVATGIAGSSSSNNKLILFFLLNIILNESNFIWLI